MKTIARTLSLTIILLGCGPLARAQETNALAVFKGLKGTWTIQSGGKTLPFKMSYDLASRDSVVTEYFGKELSVFYQDGGNLLMTHFCNAGNHPRLKLKSSDIPGRYEFEMVDITNLNDANGGDHVQEIIYMMMAPGKMGLHIIWKKGKKESSEDYTLTKE